MKKTVYLVVRSQIELWFGKNLVEKITVNSITEHTLIQISFMFCRKYKVKQLCDENGPSRKSLSC